MGDRNNPIKFGPEWLRNFAQERNSNLGFTSQNAPLASATTASAGAIAASTARPSSPVAGNSLNVAANATPKIHLAKHRYGREEMLALYDRTVEPPSELKSIDQLYQPRGKPPFALHNTFEDEMRDANVRSGPPVGTLAPDRFGTGRGRVLPVAGSVNTGKPRMPYVRQQSLGRGNAYQPRIPGYGVSAEEETPPVPRSWSSSNGGGPSANRTVNEQPEWSANKTFRNKRPTNNTNWRSSQTREEGEEWRLSEPGRPRTGQQDKWERDWGDRPNQDKPPLWNTNRRTWGGDAQNEENLPEWAIDNPEAGAGTFDSSGAFHGYSNDDTNLPKNQETSYSLTRSHTHGSFARLKSVEDGSEEWWASSKAKKLSPKKFDASDIKFKKQVSIAAADDSGNTSSSSKQSSTSKEENTAHEAQDNLVASPDSSDSGHTENTFNKNNTYRPKFSENKTFDALMRSDINIEEASDERGNFQSVTIKPNNSLRQKHQNIVTSSADNLNQPGRISGVLQGMQDVPANTSAEKELSRLSGTSPEDKIVEGIFEISLEDKNILSKLPSVIGLPLNTSTAGISSGKVSMVNSMPLGSNSGIQNNVSASNTLSQGNAIHKPNTPLTAVAGTGLLQNSIHSLGIQSSGTKTSGVSASHGLQTPVAHSGMPAHGLPSSGAQASGMQSPGIQNSVLQTLGLQTSGLKNTGMQSSGIHTQGLQASAIQSHGMQMSGMQAPGLQALGLQQLGMQSSAVQVSGMQPGIQNAANQTSVMQNIGISNAALNSAMRLQGPRLIEQGHANNSVGIPLQRMSPPPLLLTPGMANSSMGSSGRHPGPTGMPGFTNSSNIQGMANANSSLFGLGQTPNNVQMPPSSDIQMPNHGQSNMFPMHGLQHSGSQAPFTSLYGNMMRHSPPQNIPNSQSLADHWYYEDPKKNIQGPFSSKEMYNWYRAGFFSPSLMVRRACDSQMKPLGSYGTMVPFAQMDMAPFPMGSGFGIRNQGSHDSIMNSQSGLGLDVMNMSNVNVGDNSMDTLQFGTVGLVRNQPFGQQQMVDSLWSQQSTSPDLMWMQQSMNARNEMRVNNLPMFFWDQQPSAVTSNSLLPEEIVKEMKTEDQILAQLRASQNPASVPNMPFISEPSNITGPAPVKQEEDISSISTTSNLEELHKLIRSDTVTAEARKKKPEGKDEVQSKTDKANKLEQVEIVKANEPSQIKQPDTKQVKQNKVEAEKIVKPKENKSKNKKGKEEKKDVTTEAGIKEDETNKMERKSADSSPSKSKKEDKVNKKELEKEKKEWIKEGFTIVKGPEKSTKEKKVKVEEVKPAEDAERKRKEDEKLAAEEEKKKKQAETLKKQQEKQQQRQASEAVIKKAPWCAVSAQAQEATNKEGLTLSEIQRLEKEKKLEQMKEQQQMMQAIAQQQAAALAREQEMQAGLGWAKKKPTPSAPGLTLAEIQAEARQQSAAAAAAADAAAQAAQALDDAPISLPQTNHVPWGSTHNGGGFWDSPSPVQSTKPTEKIQEVPRERVEQNIKIKKKNTLNIPAKKEASPIAEFETWCSTVLTSWSAKIDVPTFVGFLKDIESPYEVKDYVKCYLGETKESSDFARQFLEKRSKLLRVGMVTPSDDLCSPAVAVNPRTTSGSDYQEVKGKGKKPKKNKMLKVDARILGFSVTAAEDRINVGDIDSV